MTKEKFVRLNKHAHAMGIGSLSILNAIGRIEKKSHHGCFWVEFGILPGVSGRWYGSYCQEWLEPVPKSELERLKLIKPARRGLLSSLSVLRSPDSPRLAKKRRKK